MPSILIVDDDEDIRDVMDMALTRHGWEVLAAADGKSALALLAGRAPPSVMLIDLRMPRMSGGELIDSLRQLPGMSEVPLLVVSGDAAARESALAMGAQGFIAKPMDLHDLVDALERYRR